MRYDDLIISLRKIGKDPSRLIFEDELTGLYNRRFLFHYLQRHRSGEAPDAPLSLLMVDLDNLKQINDQHGHAGGDLALILIGRLLKEAAGDQGLAVRYAGDEFMLLLPETTKAQAVEAGTRLLERCRAEQVRTSVPGALLQPTVSIGVASMPEDAPTAEQLIERADAALYYAKRTGRNRLADVSEVRVDEVTERAGLQNLRSASLAGRHAQLAQVAEAYEEFCRGRSQFLVIEGAAGMGKTAMLDTIRDALSEKGLRLVKVGGTRQETYRPYYLAGRVLVSLLNHDRERGAQVYERLSPAELAYLDHLLPLSDRRAGAEPPRDERITRESVFALFVSLIPRLADFGPFVLLVDDLHLADEATLLALRRLMLRDEAPLFVCGAAAQTLGASQEADHVPLERFVRAYAEELRLRRILLSPLSTTDIQEHLRNVFPRLSATDGFEESLLQITQGNPLFLGEVLHKLVADKKVVLVGHQWSARSLDEGYLPRSLEEIVRQKISSLDVESRQLLEHVSAIGDDLSLSMLTGSSEISEAKVEEFIEQAVHLGLVTSEFSEDDEVIRFLSRQVLDITYGGIPNEQKAHLHGHIGDYQEALFRQRVLPSASYLAYHFKQSANREKARVYEELQARQNSRIFDAEEAAAYSGDQPGEQLPDTPLAPESREVVAPILRALLTAVRNVKLYPAESRAVANGNRQLLEAIEHVLRANPHVKLVHRDNGLLVNGEPLDTGEVRPLVDKFLEFTRGVELGTIAFRRGLAQEELDRFLQAFARIKPAQTLERQFWKRFSFDHDLSHVHLTQVKYVDRTVHATPVTKTTSVLDADQRRHVRDVIHHLLGTVKSIKLYPRHSRTVSASFDRLMQALGRFLSAQPSLTLARAKHSLLVNGEKIDVTEFKAVAASFLEFLSSAGLKSVTFLAPAAPQEMEAFFAAFLDWPAEGGSADFWKAVARRQGLTTILFDQYDYEVESTEGAGGEADLPDVPDVDGEDSLPFAERVQRMPQQVNDLLLRGETARLREMLERTFGEFHGLDRSSRQKLVEVCKAVFDTLPFGFKPVWSNLVADPLIVICGEEKDPQIFVVLPSMLRSMAEDMIPFAEYLLAARIFSRLVALYRDLEKAHDPRVQSLGEILERKLDGKTQRLLVQDLKSGETTRQQAVVQVLGSFGPASLYLLIEIIKTEDDLRIRQLAARLLAELGPRADQAIKRELALEVTAQGRCRMLEVIDTVTQSLEAELAFVLGDKNHQVRHAAFQLAERLQTDRVTALLLSCAASEDRDLAIGAIRSLGKIKPAGASGRLIRILHATQDTEVALACCQALGHIGDHAGIEALARVLAAKGLFYLGKRWDAKVRGAAAFALRAVPAPQVTEVMTPLLADRDPRVRRVARAFVQSA